MIRGLGVALLLVGGACRSHEAPPAAAAPPHDAGPRALVVSPACRDAIHAAAQQPIDARVATLIAGCEVCGPWAPLLTWRTPQTAGGPTRAAIEAAMLGCAAFCDPNAKQRFLGTLDDARGGRSRGPWRLLGETCKAAVSAVPDTRFASATLFALDRIARAAAAAGADGAALAAIDVPLPAISISGVGVELPSSAAAEPSAPRDELTITAAEVRAGKLPIAHLTAAGVVVDFGGEPYPGALAGSAAAPAELAVLAPAKLPASRVAEVVAPLHGTRARLAAGIDAPDAWQLAGTIPVDLVEAAPGAPPPQTIALAGPPGEVTVDPAKPVRVVPSGAATVADLADLLTKLAALHVKQISVGVR